MNQNRFNSIITKLDTFVRRYYINRLIKGSLYFLGFGLAFILLIDLVEHLFRFGNTGRQVLFFSAILFLLAVFIYYIAIPLLKLLKLGKQINYTKLLRLLVNTFLVFRINYSIHYSCMKWLKAKMLQTFYLQVLNRKA